MPSFINNVKYLNLLATQAPVANRAKIKELAKAFQTKKITKLTEVERVALMLSSKNTALKKSGRAEKAYNKLMGIVAPEPFAVPGGAAPAGAAGAKLRGKKWTITMILYMDDDRIEKEADKKKKVRPKKGDAEHDGAHDFEPDDDLPPEEEQKNKTYLKKNFKGCRQYWKGQLTVRGGTEDYWANLQHRLIRQSNNKKEFNPLFKKCLTDILFKDMVLARPGYIVAFYIIDYLELKEGKGEDPKKAKKKSGEKMTIAYRYCANTLDLTKDTFKKAIALNNYVRNECWFNAIWEFYGNTLLSEGKQRNKLRRETILKLLDQTEESIKNGLTISEVLPFFVHCKLKLRVFDIFYKLVFKYDPPVANRTNKAMYCLDDGDHIYTLNHEVDRLSQKHDEEVEDKELKKLICKTDYMLDKEDKDKRRYKIIKHAEDILSILRTLAEEGVHEQGTKKKTKKKGEDGNGQSKKEDTAIYLIHDEDDLDMILFEMLDAGHKPQITFQAGRVSRKTTCFNDQKIVIESQQLVKSDIDGLLAIDDESVYNRCSDAMQEFKMRMLKQDHKSYYSEQDVEIMDEYRSTANVGWMMNQTRNKSKLVEIDVGKAYTAAFCKIKLIPVFNEFDIWKPYKGEPVKDYNLYVVRVRNVSESDRTNLFLNKTFNLSYGLFSELWDNCEIIAVKEPSFLKKVNYKTIVKDLFDTKLCKDTYKDKSYKKIIANCNYGLLEKHINKRQRSYILNNYEDCKHYQCKYGGSINYIKEYEATHIDYGRLSRDLDYGGPDHDPDDLPPLKQHDGVEYKDTGKVIWVLNQTNEADMTNGFRYIKELLIQHHNAYMQSCLLRLSAANVTVHTVKTDAYTIAVSDLPLATAALDFGGEFGQWRVSKEDGIDIKFPSERLTRKENREIHITEQVFNNIPLTEEEEWETDKLCEIFEQKKRVMIRAEYAGCGKSFACEHMAKRGRNVLFVCPTNVLAAKYTKTKEE